MRLAGVDGKAWRWSLRVVENGEVRSGRGYARVLRGRKLGGRCLQLVEMRTGRERVDDDRCGGREGATGLHWCVRLRNSLAHSGAGTAT